MRKWLAVVTFVLGAVAVQGGETVTPAANLSGRLLVYCAAGVREPVQEIARHFEAATGVKVDLTFANSGQLLGQIATTRQGDLYVPGDIGFARQAEGRQLVNGKPQTFCHFVPAILVRKGNPKGVKTVADLTKPGLKLALADPSAAIGNLQSGIFKKNNLDLAALRANTAVTPATVTDVALAVKLGTVDAGIVWDAVGRMFPSDADIVTIPAESNVVGTVAACMLKATKNPAAAKAFLAFLVSAEGRAILRDKGYAVDNP
jgi:molybdate transport system substrate-binding protein